MTYFSMFVNNDPRVGLSWFSCDSRNTTHIQTLLIYSFSLIMADQLAEKDAEIARLQTVARSKRCRNSPVSEKKKLEMMAQIQTKLEAPLRGLYNKSRYRDKSPCRGKVFNLTTFRSHISCHLRTKLPLETHLRQFQKKTHLLNTANPNIVHLRKRMMTMLFVMPLPKNYKNIFGELIPAKTLLLHRRNVSVQ